jgi:hypothetical protein
MVAKRFRVCFLNTFLVTMFLAAPLGAQEFRASITGVVTDPSGGVVPGAQVTVTNVATGVSSSTTTSATGDYTVLYLLPGEYRISVEAPGFKKLVREGIVLQTGDQLKLNLALDVGRAAQTVEVTAAAPQLQTLSASQETIYDTKVLTDMPIVDNNVMQLPRSAPGVTFLASLRYNLPFNNGTNSAIRMNGGEGNADFTLDGTPDAVTQVVGLVPPRDAVSEMQVQTVPIDASVGHTSNALIQMATKNGTNQFHGTLYEFARNDALMWNDYFSIKEGVPKAPLRYDQWGGTVGGPIVLPKVYNGRDRTFFFFNFEHILSESPLPSYGTIPTMAERAGDFSALLPVGIQIYDPLTATLTPDGHIERSPFPNNIIPANRISQIAKNYLAYGAPPNLPGNAYGMNNFFDRQSINDSYNWENVRVDRTISDKQKLFFRWSGSHTVQTSYTHALPEWLQGVSFGGGNDSTINDVYTFSPTTVAEFRFGFERYNGGATADAQGRIDPGQLGFSPQTVALFEGQKYLPAVGTWYTNMGSTAENLSIQNYYSPGVTVTKILAHHQLKFGYDGRYYRDNELSPGCVEGCYGFYGAYTYGPRDDSPMAPVGQDIAGLLLGLPDSGNIDRNASSANQTLYHSLFVQDDWKATSKLAVTLGLRYEYETPTNDRHNRNTRGFDYTDPNPIAAAAEAAYAVNPIPQIPPADFEVNGGYLFATPSKRGFWNGPNGAPLPRLGLAYHLTKNNVIRAGWGLFWLPFDIALVNQPGFSYSTYIVPSSNGGLTFLEDFANPFPNGAISPPGSSLGLATDNGQFLSINPLNIKHLEDARWQIGFQRQLPGQTLFEAAFVGNIDIHYPVPYDEGNIPAQYLSKSPFRDQATITLLTQQVANPFQGLIPNTSLNGSTVPLYQLLLPWPEFAGVESFHDAGTSFYKAAQLKLEKRFSKGWELQANYVLSQNMGKEDILNDEDTTFNEHLDGSDRTHVIKMLGLWHLPFGHGRALGNTWKGVTEAVLGGWQVAGTYSIASGWPVFFGTDYIFNGNFNAVALPRGQRTLDHWFNTSGFDTNPNDVPEFHMRTAPYTFPGLRSPWWLSGDLSAIKVFTLHESVKLQARFEFLNAFNQMDFYGPDTTPYDPTFGQILGEANPPREIQFGLRITF